jgi:hypothetical protein
MTRVVLWASAVSALVLAQDAMAQKQNYICAPGGVEKCVAACNSPGGQFGNVQPGVRNRGRSAAVRIAVDP